MPQSRRRSPNYSDSEPVEIVFETELDVTKKLPAYVSLADRAVDDETARRLGVFLVKVTEGLPLSNAAAGSGLPAKFIKGLLKESAQFNQLYERAVAIFVEKTLTALKTDGKSWQRFAWILERRFPEEFGNGALLRISDEDQALLRKLGMTPQSAWRALMSALERKMVEQDGQDS